MSAARKLINDALATGARFTLDAGRLRLIPPSGATLDPTLVAAAKARRDALIAELSRPVCSVCGSPHAPFGHGWSWRSPSTTSWFCAQHRPEVEAAGSTIATEAGNPTSMPEGGDNCPDWATAPVPGWPHHLDIFDHTKGRAVRIRLNG
jgi:hypothetical protein